MKGKDTDCQIFQSCQLFTTGLLIVSDVNGTYMGMHGSQPQLYEVYRYMKSYL